MMWEETTKYRAPTFCSLLGVGGLIVGEGLREGLASPPVPPVQGLRPREGWLPTPDGWGLSASSIRTKWKYLNPVKSWFYWNLYRQSPQFCRLFFFFFYKEKGAKYLEEAYSRNFKNMTWGQVQILPNLLFCFVDNGNWGPECLAWGPGWPSTIREALNHIHSELCFLEQEMQLTPFSKISTSSVDGERIFWVTPG